MVKKIFNSYLFTILILSALLVSSVVKGKALEEKREVGMIYATTSGMDFEISVNWQELTFDMVDFEGEVFVKIASKGMETISQEGAPSLPFMTKAFGVPPTTTLSVTATPGKMYTIQLDYPVLPSAKQEIDWDFPETFSGQQIFPDSKFALEKDLEIYSGDTIFPNTYVKILNDGFVRQQRIMGLGIYPFQYNPQTNQLFVYETLKIQIKFDNDNIIDNSEQIMESSYYEDWFLRNLENYEMAKEWRINKEELNLVNAQGDEINQKIDHLWMPPDPGWRIKIQEKGMYQINYGDLQSANFPVDDVDPTNIKMYYRGVEIAILISGNGDSVFDTDEKIIFFGDNYNSKYSQENIFWLTFGEDPGIRMQERYAVPGTAVVPGFYDENKYLEQNYFYLTGVPGGDDFERFMWAYVYATTAGVPKSWSTNFSLDSAVSNLESTLKIDILGYLAVPTNPDHHVTVSLNNQYLGEAWWDGLNWQSLQFDVPIGTLLSGTNTVTVTCPNDTGYGRDLVYIDKIELNYKSTFQSENDILLFTMESIGPWKFLINGYSNNQLSLFDISDENAVVKISGYELIGTESPYTLAFEETLETVRTYWTGTDSTYKSVLEIELDEPSNLQSQLNSADHILITHETFLSEAEILVDFRIDQGVDSILVNLQDIYDEFNYGFTDAIAIHDFLFHAYSTWQEPAPSFVLLLGDGNFDPKNYLNYGRLSFLPPYLATADPWINETAADNRYVTLVGTDTMPDMMLGRISVEDPDSASDFISKIIYYQQNRRPSDWRERILAVADNADSAGDFPVISDRIMNEHVPESYQIDRVYYGVTHGDVSAARSAIQNEINNGVFIVNYVGHGQYVAWAEEQLFKNTDVVNLTNELMYPVILSMTCYDGFYHRPGTTSGDYRSLAEVITRAVDSGAVASWSPTGLGVASGHDVLNSGFLDAIFLDGLNTLGEATLTGKFNLWMTGGSQDLLDTYLLFGDPAMEFTSSLYESYLPIIVK